MSDFATHLRALNAAATPGPWFFQGGYYLRTKDGDAFGDFKFGGGLIGDVAICAYLRNHADAIAEAVEAASRVAGTHRHCFDGGTGNYREHGCPCEICDLERALVSLNE